MRFYTLIVVSLIIFLKANNMCNELYIQSTQQAFYLIDEVRIDGELVESEDSFCVVAYKGDICVGARFWDPASCGGGVCDVPVMGADGSTLTEEYMQPGDPMPSFKIVSSSGEIIDLDAYNDYPNASPNDSGEFIWFNNSFFWRRKINLY